MDIQRVYRIIPIYRGNRYLLGIKWLGQYRIDLALPFGLRSAPGIFNSLGDVVEWILQNNYRVADLLHYLDDFFTLCPAGAMVCSNSLNALQRASLDIGSPLATDKCEGPERRAPASQAINYVDTRRSGSVMPRGQGDNGCVGWCC